MSVDQSNYIKLIVGEPGSGKSYNVSKMIGECLKDNQKVILINSFDSFKRVKPSTIIEVESLDLSFVEISEDSELFCTYVLDMLSIMSKGINSKFEQGLNDFSELSFLNGFKTLKGVYDLINDIDLRERCINSEKTKGNQKFNYLSGISESDKEEYLSYFDLAIYDFDMYNMFKRLDKTNFTETINDNEFIVLKHPFYKNKFIKDVVFYNLMQRLSVSLSNREDKKEVTIFIEDIYGLKNSKKIMKELMNKSKDLNIKLVLTSLYLSEFGVELEKFENISVRLMKESMDKNFKLLEQRTNISFEEFFSLPKYSYIEIMK